MTIDQADVIDIIGWGSKPHAAELFLTDHLPWFRGDDGELWVDEPEHLEKLRAKLNSYIHFIQSGQVRETYPELTGRKLIITVVAKYRFSPNAERFLSNAAATLGEVGIPLEYRVGFPEPVN